MKTLLLPLLLLSGAVDAADPRCAGPSAERAARFSAKALPGQSDAQRYAALVKTCGRDEIVALASRLISFPTVSAEGIEKNPAIAEMGKFLEGWAKERGFGFRALENNGVFELSWGTGAPLLGWVFHGDVVPAPAHEWKHPPFTARVDGEKLYGRGAEDDKGPLASGMVAMAFAKELGLKPQGPLLIIIGNGEESDWTAIKAYAEKQPKPRYVISVDSAFPVVVAESGFVSWSLEAPLKKVTRGKGPAPIAALTHATAGEFLTQVPGKAEATLKAQGKTSLEAVEKAIAAAVEKLKAQRPQLNVTAAREGEAIKLTALGKAVHSSGADDGQNALWDLAAVLDQLKLERNGLQAMLQAVARRFDGDHWGTKLGLAYEDALMGKLLVAPTLLRVDAEKELVTLEINLRRPQGKDKATFTRSLEQATALIGKESGGLIKAGKELYVGDPHVADVSGPLVKTLLDIYQRHQGGPAPKTLAIRGGTYARVWPGAVDFGPSLPGEEYSGHAPDESIKLTTLDATAAMLADALRILAIEGVPNGT
jgi:dipeptidase D